MINRTKIVVLGCPGREELTFQTVALFDGHGGGADLDVPKVLYWNGRTPPPAVPPGWKVEWGRKHDDDADGPAKRCRDDVWRMLRWAGDCDLVYLEDDVVPCRNALPFMVRWPIPLFTTFFNIRSLREGPWTIDVSGFWGTQAVKIPARILSRFQAEGAEKPRFAHFGQDMVFSDLLTAWKEQIFVHRSIVQHVGEVSIFQPRAKLTGARAPAADFPGVDFDAGQLQIGNADPEQ